MEETYCKDCGIQLNDENRTSKDILKQCRDCYRIYTNQKAREHRYEKQYWGDQVPLYSNHKVKKYPGEWADEEQKQYVYYILKTIGWKHNKQKDIWYDNKIKNKDGEWLVDVKRRPFRRYDSKVRNYVGKDYDKLPRVAYGKTNPEKIFDQDTLRDIQILFFIKGISTRELVEMYQCTKKNIDWIIYTTYKEFRKNSDYNNLQ